MCLPQAVQERSCASTKPLGERCRFCITSQSRGPLRRSRRGDATSDPIIDGAGTVQTAVADWLDGVGVLTVALAFATLLVIAAILTTARRARR